MSTVATNTDVNVIRDGGMFVFLANPAAMDWIEETHHIESWQYLSGCSFAVDDRRIAVEITERLVAQGFTVS